MRILLLILFVVASAIPGIAQITVQILGPSSGATYQNLNYTVEFRDNGNVITPPETGDFDWVFAGAIMIEETSTSLTVQWTSGGTNYLYFSWSDSQNYYDDDIYISVTASAPPTPNATLSTPVFACGSTTVSRTNAPPAQSGYEWYWQSTDNGTGTSLGSGTSVVLTATTALYLRARLIDSPYTWSDDDQSLGNFTVYATPPAAPAVANNSKVFAGASITVSVGTVSGADGYAWYDNSVLVPAQTTNSYTINDLVTTTIYEVAAKIGPCESAGRLQVTAAIEPLPGIQVVGQPGINMGQGPTLQIASGYATIEWLRDNMIETGVTGQQSFPVNQPGSYKVRVSKSGVTGTGESTALSITNSLDGLSMNYIVTNAIHTEGVTVEAAINDLTVQGRSQSIQYFDGLGRPLQSVATQASPAKQDLVQPMAYDQFGREAVKYLPYVAGTDGLYKANAVGTMGTSEIAADYTSSPQYQFYNNTSTTVAQDAKPYTVTKFEPSPLNRVLKQGAPGTVWQPNTDINSTADNTVKKRYEFNQANDVYLFTYNPAADELSASAGGLPLYYEANQLYANKTLDEHNNEVIEYVDNQGRTVLKRVQYKEDAGTKYYAETYYIYDDFGQLVLVLPPEFIAQMDDLFTQN